LAPKHIRMSGQSSPIFARRLDSAVNAMTRSGLSPLMIAAEYGERVPLAQPHSLPTSVSRPALSRSAQPGSPCTACIIVMSLIALSRVVHQNSVRSGGQPDALTGVRPERECANRQILRGIAFAVPCCRSLPFLRLSAPFLSLPCCPPLPSGPSPRLTGTAWWCAGNTRCRNAAAHHRRDGEVVRANSHKRLAAMRACRGGSSAFSRVCGRVPGSVTVHCVRPAPRMHGTRLIVHLLMAPTSMMALTTASTIRSHEACCRRSYSATEQMAPGGILRRFSQSGRHCEEAAADRGCSSAHEA
jgi:hypothetical protein